MSLKNKIKTNFPGFASFVGEFKARVRILLKNKENKEVFTNIFEKNSWEDNESISGPGSSITSTINFHDPFIKLLQKYKIKVLLDAPCGDFNWMKELNLQLENYIGVDIVSKLVKENEIKFGNKKIKFILADVTKDRLPESDLILCRDCFVHLSNARIISAVKNFKKSNAKYLLTTHFMEVKDNVNIITGGWRKVNMHLNPFKFPKPLELIYENCPEIGKNGELSKDKYLGLWNLKEIQL